MPFKSCSTFLGILIGNDFILLPISINTVLDFSGSFGYPWNCLILFVVLNLSSNKEMEHIWVPVLDEKCPNGYRLQQQQMLFPHRIMSYLFNECHLEIPEADIHQYWDNAIAGGETYASVESRHRVPLGIYGDSAQLITKVQFEKILCFFWIYPYSDHNRFGIPDFYCGAATLCFYSETAQSMLCWGGWFGLWIVCTMVLTQVADPATDPFQKPRKIELEHGSPTGSTNFNW